MEDLFLGLGEYGTGVGSCGENVILDLGSAADKFSLGCRRWLV